MNAMPPLYCSPEIEYVELEKKRYQTVSAIIDAREMDDFRVAEELTENCYQQLRFYLEKEFYTYNDSIEIEGGSYTTDIIVDGENVDNWWQFFKKKYFPDFLLELFPYNPIKKRVKVKAKTEVGYEVIYPDVEPKLHDQRTTIKLAYVKPFPMNYEDMAKEIYK